MVRRLVRHTIESFERKWNYDASYLKEIVDLSRRGRCGWCPGQDCWAIVLQPESGS